MVNIITGGSNSSREDMLIKRIKACAQNGADVLVIIPDQFSFEYDKKLYNALGARLFNSIRTTGFNRLCELIAQKYGGFSKDLAGDNVQIILMYRALRRLSGEGRIRYYKKSIDKGSFVQELITLTAQLRESGVTPQALELAAQRLEGTISLKLWDLSAVYAAYLDELKRANMKDALSSMAEGVRLAKDNGYFNGTAVFVSAFNSFTYDERRMLELCVGQGSDFTISLLLDSKCISRFHSHPFAVTVKTQQQIVDMARTFNKKLVQIEAEDTHFSSEDLLVLSKNLFNVNRPEYTAKGDVRIYASDDMYEEADFICAEICRLIREEGLRYNDIVISMRDMQRFMPIIEGVLERYDIPYFIDKRDSVCASAIVHYINAVFMTVLTKSFKTENIMKLIKSPLFGILNYDVADLEDYCQMWGVDGDMWLSPFTAGGSKVNLEKINRLREQIITPLAQFKSAGADKSAKEICRAFYKLLSEIKLSEQTYSVVRRAAESDNQTQGELARGLKQLWNMSLSAVKSIYECMGDEKITLRQFYELYRIMLSQMKISNPPQKLDCVRVTDAARSRTDGVRVMFAAEVNDGVFPAAVKSGGLVTNHEKELLRLSENIVIESNAMTDFQNERLVAYSTLTAPTDRLYMTYTKSDLLGNQKRPSMLIKEAVGILGVEVHNVNSLPIDFFCASYKTAYTKYIEHSKDKTSDAQSIYESVKGSSVYYDRLKRLNKLNANENYQMSPEIAGEVFFRTDVTEVSPTKLNTYFVCPFKYFCSYGLKLQGISRAEINPINIGNIVHGFLERAMSTNLKQPLDDMTDEDLKQSISEYILEYCESELGGGFGKKPTFDYQIKQLESRVLLIVRFVREELSQTSFKPKLTEYKIKHDGENDSLELTLNDTRKIVLAGTVDRADILEGEDGSRYVRIIDYKTGEISFDLADLYRGLNLQMLVYLSSIIETKNEINEDMLLKQAGIFYFDFHEKPKITPDCEMPEEELYERACIETMSRYHRKGALTDSPDVAAQFSEHKDTSGRLLEMGDTTFTAMREYAKGKVVEYGNRLLSGDIAAKPCDDVCGFCDYTGICRLAKGEAVSEARKKEYRSIAEQEIAEIAKKIKPNEKGECEQ